MSGEQQVDPYEVLAVARDADARAVKAAYFALVRKFPPETHPEEFQQLRAAYEVLSDPERREQLDAARDAFADLGAEQGALLRAANGAFAQGDPKGAEALLRRAIADYPDLLAAREMLAFAQLRQKEWGAAVGSWSELVDREPGNARYHLHLGYARHGMEAYADAAACYRKAIELGGGAPARAALADALADQKDWKGALRVLEEGIGTAGAKAPPPLVRRKVALLLLNGSARKAWRAFDELATAVKDAPEERAGHADELASLAAWLFAKGQHKKANELLRRLAAIDPNRRPDRLFPERSTLRVKELPPESAEWIAGRAATPHRVVFTEGGRLTGAAVAILPGLLAAWLAVLRCTSDRRWDGSGIVLTGLLLAAATFLLAFGGRRFHAALAASLPRMRILHPVHYLEVDFDRVRIFPLVNLHDVKVIRHSTNGIYTHTVVHLPFGRKVRRVSYRSEAQASAFAEALLQRRRRVLELLARGLLENEDGIDLVPSAVLAAGARRRFRQPLLLAGGALAAAALLLAVSAGVNRRVADATEWAKARATGRPASLRAWAEAHPRPVEGERVKAGLSAWVAGLERGPGALPPGPGRESALSVARALASGTSPRLALEVAAAPLEATPPPAAPEAVLVSTRRGRRAPPPPPPARLPDPGVAWPAAAPSPYVSRVVRGLQAAFDRALGPGTVRVESGGQKEGLSLAVALAPRPAGAFRDASGPALAAVELGWAASLSVPGSEPRRFTGRIPPPPELSAPPGWREGQGPDALYRAGAEAQVDLAVRELAAALGLAPAIPAIPAMKEKEVTP